MFVIVANWAVIAQVVNFSPATPFTAVKGTVKARPAEAWSA